MENQTNYPAQQPQQPRGSSGANTVLLVIIILALAGGGYWLYKNQPKPSTSKPVIDVNVNLQSPEQPE